MNLDSIINLTQYPISNLENPLGQTLVSKCQQQLELSGACVLPEFIKPDALIQVLNDVDKIIPDAFQVDHVFAYDDTGSKFEGDSKQQLPPDHPRNFGSLTKIRFIARDLIPETNPVLNLFCRSEMTDFIARVMGMPNAYPYDCPLSSCVFTVAEQDELQDWHFDGIDFIVTLMLQNCVDGGNFEYVPGLRSSEKGDDFAKVSRILKGDRDLVETLPLTPGALTIFKGRYSLHRASPVQGDGRRVMAVLSYEDQPGRKSDDDFLKLFYGRTADQALERREKL